jgi:cyclopropane fatty-acyl-phospholipid synthase-like methyltransferase
MGNKEFTWAKAKALDWENYLPPVRPSISELAVIEKYFVDQLRLNPQKKFELAILGCTVEFRSLAHKYGMGVTLIDVSKMHYEILSKQHMAYTGAEEFVALDWRNMHTKKKFDIILGDLVMNMLGTKNRDSMLKNVSEILVSDGIFISRNWIKPKSNLKDFAAVVKYVRKKYPHVHFYTTTAGFVYPAYINNTEFADVRKLKSDLVDLKKKKLINVSEYKYWRDRLKYEIKGVSVITLKYLGEQFSKYFKIINIKEGIDIYSDKFKIHFLKNK